MPTKTRPTENAIKELNDAFSFGNIDASSYLDGYIYIIYRFVTFFVLYGFTF